jgi:hypothetical protein
MSIGFGKKVEKNFAQIFGLKFVQVAQKSKNLPRRPNAAGQSKKPPQGGLPQERRLAVDSSAW